MHNIYQKIALWFFVIALLLLGIGGYFYGKSKNSVAYQTINQVIDKIVWWNNVADQEVITKDDQPKDVQKIVDNLPAERTVDFTWNYQGREYSIKVDLKKDLYEQYRNSTKTYSYIGKLPPDWVEKYYSLFFELKPGDGTIQKIATDIDELSKQNGLSGDQSVELIIAFIQSIPYDKEREGNIINRVEGEFTNYPYETLYNNMGICFDKTFLGILILQELGYGTAVLDFEEANHSAIGIACPAEYSIYGSGYCFAESTNFFPVGVVPQRQADIVSFDQDLATFSGQFDNIFSPNSLGRADILHKTDGKQYLGIEATYKKVEAVKAIEKKIDQERALIQQKEEEALKRKEEISKIETTLREYQSANNQSAYNNLKITYNSKIRSYNDLVGLIQLKIKMLNEDVKKYNAMITDFVVPQELLEEEK